jgi:hypothetical protein
VAAVGTGLQGLGERLKRLGLERSRLVRLLGLPVRETRLGLKGFIRAVLGEDAGRCFAGLRSGRAREALKWRTRLWYCFFGKGGRGSMVGRSRVFFSLERRGG